MIIGVLPSDETIEKWTEELAEVELKSIPEDVNRMTELTLKRAIVSQHQEKVFQQKIIKDKLESVKKLQTEVKSCNGAIMNLYKTYKSVMGEAQE